MNILLSVNVKPNIDEPLCSCRLACLLSDTEYGARIANLKSKKYTRKCNEIS